MLLLALLLQQAPSPAPVADQVVVVGRSLTETGDALARCLARHCPPAEDIQATIAHADNQFLAGDYDGARQTLGRGRHRNKRFAAALPVPVSNLLAAHAYLSSLTGLADVGRIGTIDSVDALRAGLPPRDPRIADQRLRIGDVFAEQGRFDAAIQLYDAVASWAKVAGLPEQRAHAMFRAATLYAVAASIDPSYGQNARRRLDALRAEADPAFKPYRDATVALKARVAAMNGNRKALAGALDEAKGVRTHDAILIFDPALDLDELMPTGTANDPMDHDTAGQWLDIAFTVAPDGSVKDVGVIRKGEHAGGVWVDRVTRSVAKRRYLPLDQPADAPGLPRLERFSLVADLGGSTSSRIRTHNGPPRVQVTDLTPATPGG